MKGDVVVILASGEAIDISDLAPSAAVQLLRDRQITPADIRETRHRLRGVELPPAPARASRGA